VLHTHHVRALFAGRLEGGQSILSESHDYGARLFRLRINRNVERPRLVICLEWDLVRTARSVLVMQCCVAAKL